MTYEEVLEKDLEHCTGCENFYKDDCTKTCAYGIHRNSVQKQIPVQATVYNFPKAQIAFCPECNNLLGKDSKYCDKCGQRVRINANA